MVQWSSSTPHEHSIASSNPHWALGVYAAMLLFSWLNLHCYCFRWQKVPLKIFLNNCFKTPFPFRSALSERHFFCFVFISVSREGDSNRICNSLQFCIWWIQQKTTKTNFLRNPVHTYIQQANMYMYVDAFAKSQSKNYFLRLTFRLKSKLVALLLNKYLSVLYLT
jgi:hypothetical protein